MHLPSHKFTTVSLTCTFASLRAFILHLGFLADLTDSRSRSNIHHDQDIEWVACQTASTFENHLFLVSPSSFALPSKLPRSVPLGNAGPFLVSQVTQLRRQNKNAPPKIPDDIVHHPPTAVPDHQEVKKKVKNVCKRV